MEELEERRRSCEIVKKEIDDFTVDKRTGRRLGLDELSRDELIELALHLRKYILYCCKCNE